ncbi:MFS transporter [Actinomyces oris]|uniref:MFS transporter n=1 Tax=Actinomyces oris TaxID=544580 RepID=A0A1Q8HYK4_9ACTO|nr:MFS transporter [Actinomyces oris]OLL13930.1 MFS transporter [Actinomyces oris]
MHSATSLSTPPVVRRSPELIRARAGVCLVFLANGLGFANLVPRFPEIVAELGLSKSAFGQAVAAASVGALVAGLAASWLISRLTSAKVASLGMLVVSLALLGAGLARSWLVLAVCLLVVGGTDAIVDVAQNAHGLRVQRRWGASIVTSFHASWSLGAVLGAAMGQAMAGAGVGLGTHMVLTAVVLLVVSGGPLLAGWFLPGHDRADRAPDQPGELDDTPAEARAAASPRCSWPVTILVLIVVGLLCSASMFPEDVAMNWSSLLLSEQGAGASHVGLGLVALQGTMIVGRLVGDRIIDAIGQRAVIAWGGALVTLGMSIALLLSSVPGTLLGMAISGAGCAVAVPVAYSAADDVEGLPPGLGLTIVSWLARLAGLLAPPVVGRLADDHGLWVALAYGLLGGLIMITCWPVLHRRPAGD